MKQKAENRRRQLFVINSSGKRQRFLRGMITHDLAQKGLPFDDAYALARSVRDQLSDREEVESSEIRDLVEKQLEVMGLELPPVPEGAQRVESRCQVIYHGRKQPFSRGVLARSLFAAGVDFDRAYRLVVEIETDLLAERVEEAQSADIARRASEALERFEGVDAARRYRLVRQIHRLPRPLVVYLGGASGTGKSTLALELAPLLRIYRINSTDTVRQVMRMVFSQTMLPALHSSSFELAPEWSTGGEERIAARSEGSEPDRRLIASFEEQSLRVAVGMRAVVERATAENMSILVEGVHLFPPVIPFRDLEGAVYQMPFMLAIPDREVHRSRFLARARFGGRRAERYLENFPAIRTIHDFLLEQAEAYDIPLLDTSFEEPPVLRSLRLITGLLEKKVSGWGETWPQQPDLVPTLLILIDGLPDRPVRALGGRTPLQAANTPNLDRLALEGQCGLADSIAPGVVPDTAAGTLSALGQSPLVMKRGPVEALGAGLELRPGDIALRGNLATLDANGVVIDRRAGRIRDEAGALAKALDRLPLPGSLAEDVEVRVRPGTEHRLAIVLRGPGLSSAIQGSDPGDGAPPGPPLPPQPLDSSDDSAIHTARILALFEQRARKILTRHSLNRERQAAGLPPANTILTRGAGKVHRLAPLEQGGMPLRLACVSGDRTVLGLASWLGADLISSSGMTANLDTDLVLKFAAARKALKRKDLVLLHVKGADIASHDQRPELKVEYLERFDQALGLFLEEAPESLRIAVASDHATLSESGQHAADPLPVLIWGEGIEADEVSTFDETSVILGRLQQFPLQMLLGRLFDLA